MTTAERYDLLRKSIPFVYKPNVLLLTRGIVHSGMDLDEVLRRVREFNDFREENDPWREHDFGGIALDGNKIFWKIDDYGGQDGYDLVLTIMLAEEY